MQSGLFDPDLDHVHIYGPKSDQGLIPVHSTFIIISLFWEGKMEEKREGGFPWWDSELTGIRNEFPLFARVSLAA